MSKERSPRDVCSRTIGTSELCARPICIGVSSPINCNCLVAPQYATDWLHRRSMEHAVERELVVPEPAEEVWRSLAEPDWLGEDAPSSSRPAGEVRAGERVGFVEEADAPEGWSSGGANPTTRRAGWIWSCRRSRRGP